ncbi:hypothetical protein Leryth_014231 [Lithospermum erythrorhizon]|nr:hypothetical protein Leryth_014231 [Lithospermum erythrorhizon]
METENNATNLHVASFACYLDTENNFMHKIKKALEDPTPQTISSPEKSFQIHQLKSKPPLVKSSSVKNNNNHISHSPRVASFSHYLNNNSEENFMLKVTSNIEKSKVKDGEIDIFGADKYFKMKLDDETQPCMNNRTPNNLHNHKKSNVGSKTPSVYSEASSWNSQTALMKKLHYQRNPSDQNLSDQMKQKKALGMRFLNSFACTGPCMEKKSIYVNQNRPDYGSRLTNDHYPSQNFSKQAEILSLKLEDQPRESLEVFGCKSMRKGDIVAANLERKVSMLSWDAIPKAESFTTTTQKSSSHCDDMASDASSDLFEIENILGNGYDTISSCMSPTNYAPSEASIQWSVVTASAAEFASVISDNYEERSVSVAGDVHSRSEKTIKSAMVAKGGQKSNKTGGFLGCNSQKAVDVAETHVLNAKNVNQKGKNHGVDLNVSLSKLQASAKVKDIVTFTPR